MQISHEVPFSLLEKSLEFNDYDYALVHLFQENPSYFSFFLNSLNKGRKVLLDNSVYELGTAFNTREFIKWINLLKPTEYIIPDVFNDASSTINNAKIWMEQILPKVQGIPIAVLQGKNYDEMVECYEVFDKELNIPKIAITFGSGYYFSYASKKSKVFQQYEGRMELVSNLMRDGIINPNKPHHLLGCSLPQEFLFYRGIKWIESIDTSNPVLHGLKGLKYTEYGMDAKLLLKMAELMSQPLLNEDLVKYNINRFRHFCGREEVGFENW